MAGANYDNAALFYDRLSRLVFGNALKDAQTSLLPRIPFGSSVLIIGGGTGWILEEIAKVHPSALSITYVEISANMMKHSKKRDVKGNDVEFITEAMENVAPSHLYDVVLTPFLLDNYTEAALPAAFVHIHQSLKPGGIWLYTDFRRNGPWWQQAMMKSMLLFFKVLCGVEAWHLPDADAQFERFRYTLLAEMQFYDQFITARAYRKAD